MVSFLRMARWAVVPALLTGLTAFAHADPGFDLARHRGKVVLVDFWASWCVPCRQSFPWLNDMQSRYGSDGLVVIGVNVDRERSDAERFLGEVPARFEIVYDPEGSLAAHYDLVGMPSSLVFDSSGRLVTTHVGFKAATRDAREAELQKLLSSARAPGR